MSESHRKFIGKTKPHEEDIGIVLIRQHRPYQFLTLDYARELAYLVWDCRWRVVTLVREGSNDTPDRIPGRNHSSLLVAAPISPVTNRNIVQRLRDKGITKIPPNAAINPVTASWDVRESSKYTSPAQV